MFFMGYSRSIYTYYIHIADINKHYVWYIDQRLYHETDVELRNIRIREKMYLRKKN